jgi:hypothetical protein
MSESDVVKQTPTMTVSKRYERKVNLSAISSQYDNISLGTFLSCEMEVEGMEHLKEKMRKMYALVVSETERDIRETFIRLKSMAEDKKNLALVGTGKTLEIEDKITPMVLEEPVPQPAAPVIPVIIDEPASKPSKPKKSKKSLDEQLEEVNLDDFDPADYEGGKQ